MRTNYVVGDRVVRVEVKRGRDHDRYEVVVDGAPRRVELLHADGGRLLLRIDGRRVRADVARDGDRRLVKLEGGAPLAFDVGDSVASRSKARADGGLLAAAMHSQVVAVEVGVGDPVATGDTLVVLEAMKMETRITAPHDGVVKAVRCAAGDVVEPGVALVELEEG